jgi:hypothetical protein
VDGFVTFLIPVTEFEYDVQVRTIPAGNALLSIRDFTGISHVSRSTCYNTAAILAEQLQLIFLQPLSSVVLLSNGKLCTLHVF